MARNRNANQLASHGAQAALDQMKYEIAQEFGVQLGADTSSRANGSVGGEITKTPCSNGRTTAWWRIYSLNVEGYRRKEGFFLSFLFSINWYGYIVNRIQRIGVMLYFTQFLLL